ncbi:YidB family protein [Streptomyces sp. NPDC059096]|uniref:YidB family protein n=1 Tax=Streptomyces sp. NPDC059096 TaxID=3346727 RepID=UPI0036C5579F
MTNAAEEISAEEFGDFLVLLADKGLADEVGSWVSDQVGNRSITGEQLLSVLDADEVAAAAAEAGVSVQEYADGLAEQLPHVVDKATPQGELPDDEEFRHLQNA